MSTYFAKGGGWGDRHTNGHTHRQTDITNYRLIGLRQAANSVKRTRVTNIDTKSATKKLP